MFISTLFHGVHKPPPFGIYTLHTRLLVDNFSVKFPPLFLQYIHITHFIVIIDVSKLATGIYIELHYAQTAHPLLRGKNIEKCLF